MGRSIFSGQGSLRLYVLCWPSPIRQKST